LQRSVKKDQSIVKELKLQKNNIQKLMKDLNRPDYFLKSGDPTTS
jgi:hypothetical protein